MVEDKELKKAREETKKMMDKYRKELKDRTERLEKFLFTVNKSVVWLLSDEEIKKLAEVLAELMCPSPLDEQRGINE